MSLTDVLPTIPDRCTSSHLRHAADRIAVVCEDQHITYRQLHTRVSAAALALHRHGVYPGVVVGLFVERSPTAVIGLLAILRAGGTYLPLDVAWPPDRVTEICRIARLGLVLTSDAAPQIAWPAGVVALHFKQLHSTGDVSVKLPPIESQQPAFVIYTSGSTGEPKGVTVSHRAIAARLDRDSNPSAGPHMQRASLSVIGHVGDVLAPLAGAVTIVIAPDKVLRHAAGLAAWLRDHAVTRLVLIPSQLQALLDGDNPHLDAWERLKFVVVTGEPLPPTVAAAFIRRFTHVPLINGYGLTETVGLVAAAPVESADDITIGRGMPPTRMFLMDEAFENVAAGTVGELCVAGAQLATGYLNRPELTADRFVPNPRGAAGERCYRTGDMGRWTPRGVQLLGRRDDEVKIRGFRVNLTEVARAIERHEAVAAAIALAASRSEGTRQLHAWAVARSPWSRVDGETLRRHAASYLPSHMVPATVHVVSDFPYLPNGKIDRGALAAILDGHGEPAVPPALSATAARVAAIWSETFGVEAVGANDDFFEHGGDSLMAMTILAGIAAELGVEVSPEQLFDHPTVQALSDLIDRRTT